AARIACAGRLDLDHLGAVVGEGERQIRPRQKNRQIDDLQPLQLHFDNAGAGAVSPSSSPLSAPSAEHTRCSGRRPFTLSGLASSFIPGKCGCGTLRTMPTVSTKGLASARATS